MAWADGHWHLPCCPPSSTPICSSPFSILTPEIKVDQSHVKGAKTKGKNKAKKDKKKNQNSDLEEKKAAKVKVDELVVSVFSYHLQQLFTHRTLLHTVLRYTVQYFWGLYLNIVFEMHLNSKFWMLFIFRCTIRSWRLNLMTLRIGFTPSTCLKERLEMTRMQTMKIGSWADSKYNSWLKAGQTTYSDSDKMHLCTVLLTLLTFFDLWPRAHCVCISCLSQRKSSKNPDLTPIWACFRIYRTMIPSES